MLIIGLNAFHPDAAACVLVDGHIVAAIAEERLGERVKHIGGFPARALLEVLKIAGASISDVDYISIGHDSRANLRAKYAYVLRSPARSARQVQLHLQRKSKIEDIRSLAAATCQVSLGKCRFQVIDVEHHLAHIASAFYASDFDNAAGFSYDGAGDFTSSMYARCVKDKITILRRVHTPHSLGFFYEALCQFIGFDRYGEEYKVMGLAAYGEPTYLDLLRRIVRSDGSGRFRLDLSYFLPLEKTHDECMDPDGVITLPNLYSSKMASHFGKPRRRDSEITQRDKDIAASFQARFEELVIECLTELHRISPSAKLVTAGGCALNGVCNARILRETPFKQTYIQCAASDDGTAVGAAMYVWNSLLKGHRSVPIDHAYWGGQHTEAEMERALNSAGLVFEKLSYCEIIEAGAAHLNAGHVMGWYQGRSEWGPRALGNRSILAHPGWPGMKDLINEKVKRREPFRPFAPSILADRVYEYFEQDLESPFMMHVVKIKPEKRADLAAVCHIDSTGRLHTVNQRQNKMYYDLIKAFDRASGIPVVLNTSFNENEPIVETPEQAVSCFVRTDIDVLCIGPFICCKPGKSKLS